MGAGHGVTVVCQGRAPTIEGTEELEGSVEGSEKL